MLSLTELNLSENPFKNITPIPGQKTDQELPWADMSQVKNNLEEVYNRASSLNSRQVILNWGPYGGGKTFAAYHFIDKEYQNEQLTQIYIRSPKDGNNAPSEFFKGIIDFLSFSGIQKQVKKIVEESSEEEVFKLIDSNIRSEEFAESILLFNSDDEDDVETLRRYIYSGLTKTELKKAGLHRNIDSTTDKIKFLAGIFTCYIANRDGNIILWIDEMEDLVYFTKKQYTLFSRMIRDLIDTMNYNFTLFFNFTLAEPDESTIELLLGDAINRRIDKRIRLKEFSEEDALTYCKDLIDFYKIEDKNNLYPFTEEALKLVFKSIRSADLTPSEINKSCSRLLEFSLQKNKNLIDEETTRDWINKYYE